MRHQHRPSALRPRRFLTSLVAGLTLVVACGNPPPAPTAPTPVPLPLVTSAAPTPQTEFGTLSGVVTGDGQPLAGVHVWVMGSFFKYPVPVKSGESDPAGHYVVDGVPAVSGYVTGTSEGYFQPCTATYAVNAAGTAALDLFLMSAARLEIASLSDFPASSGAGLRVSATFQHHPAPFDSPGPSS